MASLSKRMIVYGVAKKFPAVKHITCEQLEQWRIDGDKNLVLLDTRASEEFAVSHLPGAIHVDPDQEHSLTSLSIAPESTVVCYCSVGYRSSSVACKLRRSSSSSSGLSSSSSSQLYNLEGGVFQWSSEGRGLVDALGHPTTLVHPYSSFWGRLLPSEVRARI